MLHGAGIFAYIYPNNDPNVGNYSIHGAFGACFGGTYRLLVEDDDGLEISRLTGFRQFRDKSLGGRTRCGGLLV